MKNRGFTLLELSIVIMIIAILMGGIFAFRSWQQSSQLKAVITEYYNYREAITQFKETYGQLPGDFTNASSFWPACATPATLCNGNGDGYIQIAANGTTQDEHLRAWQQLYLAGFIGQYMSGYHITTWQDDIGVNVPTSKYTVGGWYFDNRLFGTVSSNANMIVIGGFVAGTFSYGAIFTPAQVLNIDSKIDDGRPMTGVVHGAYTDLAGTYFNGLASGGSIVCSLSASNSYNVGNAASFLPQCTIAFLLDPNSH